MHSEFMVILNNILTCNFIKISIGILETHMGKWKYGKMWYLLKQMYLRNVQLLRCDL
jgi:hypothetical protein